MEQILFVFLFIWLLLVPLGFSSAKLIENEEWQAFKLDYSRKYKNDVEEKLRMQIFMENQLKIVKYNERYGKGEVSYKLAMNKFGDLSHPEFVARMNGFNHTLIKRLNKDDDIAIEDPVYFVEPANIDLPSSFDWRDEGAVTEVKFQGQNCGSCWAFSASGALEGQHFRKSGRLVSLSEQNLMDCSSAYGNEGCDGGYIHSAFQYIKDNGGIDTEKSYPYKAIVHAACKYRKRASGAIVRGFVNIPEGNEKKLVIAIASVGPISVAIDASHESFQFYSSGIYYEPKCHRRPEQLDHAVLAVGFGSEKSEKKYEDFYFVKNSYGTDWGIDGYIKMARNRKNHCGIATEATFPLV